MSRKRLKLITIGCRTLAVICFCAPFAFYFLISRSFSQTWFPETTVGLFLTDGLSRSHDALAVTALQEHLDFQRTAVAAGLGFLTASILLWVVSAAAITAAVVVLRFELRIVPWLVVTLGCLAAGTALAFSTADEREFATRLLIDGGFAGLGSRAKLLPFQHDTVSQQISINLYAILPALVVLLAAFGSLCWPDIKTGGRSVLQLRRRLSLVRPAFLCAVGLLVVAVAAQRGLTGIGEAISHGVPDRGATTLAEAVTTWWGANYTIMLLIVIACVSVSLRLQSEALALLAGLRSFDRKLEWREQNKLQLVGRDLGTSALAALGPFLTGPALDLVANLGSSLGTS